MSSSVTTAPAKPVLPKELEELRPVARKAISPLKPADHARGRLFVTESRTKAGRDLPPYYLVYFLLVEFLNFPHSGQWEKVAWSIPLEFEGDVFLVEHRKFGLGVFCDKPDALQAKAQKVVALIAEGVRVAKPFFRWLAAEAVRNSHINIKNNSVELFGRYEFFREEFRKGISDARAHGHDIKAGTNPDGSVNLHRFPDYQLLRKAQWLGSAAVDAFFAWTEHVFIHLAIIQRRVITGEEVAAMIEADWVSKFKKALDLGDKDSKKFYDRLAVLRRQIRNYTAHGSFGKQGEAFSFHSGAGAVPVTLSRSGFSLFSEPEFEEESAISTLEEFIVHLWSGPREPARIYIQDAGLPLIMTFASGGTYERAMSSVEDMDHFVEGLTREMDNAANMDW